jgi:riboflavin biosynthesis pyrimidine reductase
MDAMQQLFPRTDTSSNVDVHEFFGRDWLDAGGLRVNFIASVDGAVTIEGKSAGLQTPGDNRIFAALRDLADVVVVGAGTARTEDYGPLKPSAARVQKREENGLAPTLPIALVTRSLGLDPNMRLFTAADPHGRTLVFTCAAARPAEHADLGRVAEVIVCGEAEVDLSEVHGILVGRGLTRILCEGGPSLFADLAATGNVSELCLSISPLLAGPGSGRILGGLPWLDSPHQLELHGLLEEGGALFARYRVGTGPDRAA